MTDKELREIEERWKWLLDIEISDRTVNLNHWVRKDIPKLLKELKRLRGKLEPWIDDAGMVSGF